jgi:hypothetical protein
MKNTRFTEMGRETVDWINNIHLWRILADTVRSDPVQKNYGITCIAKLLLVYQESSSYNKLAAW